MGLAGLLAAALALGAGGVLAAGSGFRREAGWPRALAASVLAWAWLTIGLQVLGSTGFLTGPAILVVALVGLAVGLLVRWRLGERPRIVEKTTHGWGLAATGAVGLTVVVAIQLGTMSLLVPPRIFSDGPIYHLFFAARWWKAGGIELIASPFGENAATYFPANGDLLFSGLMALYGGDRPARIGQSPFLLMGALAAYGIARRLGSAMASSTIAACLFVTSLPLILFGFEANVDALFVAGYLAAVAFGLEYALGEGDLGSLVLAGLAAGAAWGTKPTATAFIPPLVLIGAGLIARKKGLGRSGWFHLLAMLAATLAPCGFWFGRSLWMTGNPLYPMHLEAFGRIVLHGWYPSVAMRRSQFYLPMDDWRAFLSILMMVFDARLVPLWGLALIGFWARGWPRSGEDRGVWVMAALAVLNVGMYWLAIPYRTQQRFMLQAAGLAAAPVARLLDRWPPLRWVAIFLLGVHLVSNQAWPLGGPGRRAPWEFSEKLPRAADPVVQIPLTPRSWALYWEQPGGLEFLATVALMLAGGFATAALWGIAARSGNRRWGLLSAIVCTGTVAGVLYGTDDVLGHPSRRVFPKFDDYQRSWAALEALSPPGGTRVAYAGTNLPYYLMAGGLRNHVEYVNVDAHRDWQMHDYHLSAIERGEPYLAQTPGPRFEVVHPAYDEHLARQAKQGQTLLALWDTPRPGWDRIHPDYASWLANLRTRRIRLLVVAHANPIDGPFNQAEPQGFPIERVWADAHPEIFDRVYPRQGEDFRMRIYRVRGK